MHTALVAGLAEPLQKGLYSLCFAVAPVAPCIMGEYAQRVCGVTQRARRDVSRHLVAAFAGAYKVWEDVGRKHAAVCDAVGAYTRDLDIYLHACWGSACLRGFGHVQTGKEVQDDARKARENQLRVLPCVSARGVRVRSRARVRNKHACMHSCAVVRRTRSPRRLARRE